MRIPSGWTLSEVQPPLKPENCINRYIGKDGESRHFQNGLGIAEFLEYREEQEPRYEYDSLQPAARYRIQGARRFARLLESGRIIEKIYPNYWSGWEALPSHPNADICCYCGFNNNAGETSARLGYACGYCGNC